jgi:predicted negative regulator of RcsB-dependent stress response
MLYINDKRYFSSVLILVLFNIILIKLPLTSVFGYEFSALNSILLIIVAGLLVISFLKRKENFVKNILKISPILLSVPLMISVTNSLITTTCSLTDGFLFYLVITVPSIVIGSALGLASYYIIPKYSRIIFIFLLCIIAIIPVLEIYFNPQIYFYNPLVGFYPGTIYDEKLSITFRLVIYRLINVIFFLFLIYAVNRMINQAARINKFSFLIIVSSVVIIFLLCSSFLGFSTTKSRIETSLKGKCYTEHFEIIYDTSIDSTYLKNVIINHEFFYFELKKFFMDEPHRKITSFIFKNNRQKGKLFGSENADVAKPWLYQIYITAGSYDISLKHEIAHIFSASFGIGPFKLAHNFNPALIEGIAEAAAPFYNTWYLDQIASVAYNNDYKFTIDNLYSGLNFFGQTSGLSYVYAGSFTNYLINRFGINKFKEWYKGKSFSEVYDSSLTDIAGKYYEYLQQLGYENKQNTAQYYFGKQTIFSKFCPRYIAGQLELGWDNYNHNNYTDAARIFDYINRVTQNYSALYGLILSKVELKKEKEALFLLTKEISKYNNSSDYFSLELLRGDLLIRNRKYEQAKGQYYQLNRQSPDLHYNYLSKLRLDLSQNDSSIYNYIAGGDSAKFEILKNYNLNSYDYASFPVMIDLAGTLHKSYNEILSLFGKNIIVNDIYSRYATYYLSRYMSENLDYVHARKLAALAARFKNGNDIQIFLRSYLIRIDWIYPNYEKIMNDVKYIYATAK